MKHIKIILFLLLLPVVFTACNTTRHLPPGETLYGGPKITVHTADNNRKAGKALSKELATISRPLPNGKILGLRVKLAIYNLGGHQPKEKGLGHFIQKLGEAPVLASDVNMEKNRQIMENRLENKGMFQATVTADTTVKGRVTYMNYTAVTGPQYKYKSIQWPDSVTSLRDTLSRYIARSRKRTTLKEGQPYDLQTIILERQRIDLYLKDKGFFYFNPEDVLVQIDTNAGDHGVNAYVTVKSATPANARQRYHINDIWLYDDYTTEKDSIMAAAPATDYKDFHLIDPEHKIKPIVFDRLIGFHKGDIYSRTKHNQTLSRLQTLGTFRFIKARFEEVDTAGNYLDPYFFMTPLPKKQWRLEVTGLTKSNNATGSDITISWKNRNAFHGAELLTANVHGGIEQQVSGTVNVSTIRYGAGVDLLLPRILSPINFGANSQFVPRTKFSLAYEFFNRTSQYTLNSYIGTYGFVWKSDIRIEHQLNPISINYVRPTNITADFQQALDTDITLARSIEKQFIIGPTYNYNFNSLARANNRRNNFYFNFNADVSGTLLGIGTGATFSNKQDDSKKILGAAFSQYGRLETEIRHYLRIGDSKTRMLASRLLVGAGVAYGNSESLPFVKAFFIGGANSLRGWRARSLGPGTYYVRNFKTTGFLPDQPGDMKIEANTELRGKLFSFVNGALFMDASNIWLLHNDTSRPGGQFSGAFLNQLAVDMGAGLRVDLSFLVIRVDLAMPIRKPYQPGGPAWVFNQINFGDAAWRRENLVLNLAIGYPF